MAQVFKALDEKQFSWFHVKMIIVSGMGFLTDSYDLFCIGLLTNLLGRIYYQDNPFDLQNTVKPGKLPIGINAAVSAVALVGTLCGQLFWGYIGDKFGRKSAYGIVLVIMIFSAIAQGLSFGTTADSVMATLCFWRFWLGFGVGGDYPISATIMSEFSSTKNRGAYVGAVFAMQGIGILLAAGISAIISAGFDRAFPSEPFPVQVAGCNSFVWEDSAKTIPCPYENQEAYYNQVKASCPGQTDFVWRIVLMFGAVPGLLTIYFRTQITESPRYTAVTAQNVAQAEVDIHNMLEGRPLDEVVDVKVEEVKVIEPILTAREFFWTYKWQLLGTSMCWFFLDIAFYSQTLFQKDVFVQVGFTPQAINMYALEELSLTSKAQAIVALGSTIPGYWCTVFTVDYIGRKPIQLMGFFMMTGFMLALCLAYHRLLDPNTPSNVYLSHRQPDARNGWIAMYCLAFFFANFGPNSTTFIYPAELYPTAWKSTGHGFSAACGKAGAIVGAFGFLYASSPKRGDTTYSFPCTKAAYDFSYDPALLVKKSDLTSTGSCIEKNNCPTGRTDPGFGKGYCDQCTPGVKSGCYPYGIGLIASLGVLAATNACGFFLTFLLPETNQRSLEELNASPETTESVKELKSNVNGSDEL